MVRALLTDIAGADTPTASPALVHDLLWAHAAPADGLEHLRIRRLAHGLDVVLFLAARTDEAALRSAGALLDRARIPLSRHGCAGGLAR
nr:hypothetical protein [Streptomyces omiyaensis]